MSNRSKRYGRGSAVVAAGLVALLCSPTGRALRREYRSDCPKEDGASVGGDDLSEEVKAAIAGASPEVQALFAGEVAFERLNREEPMGFVRGARIHGERPIAVFGQGRTHAVPTLDPLIEEEEASELAATPHHGELRAEAQRKVVAEMNRRGVKVPLSMLLS